MKAAWLSILLVVVIALTATTTAESPFAMRMNSITEQLMKGPTFFGDPIGRMFHSLRQRIDEENSAWWPNFMYNDPTHPYPEEETEDVSSPSLWEKAVVATLQQTKDDLLSKFDGVYIPAELQENSNSRTLVKRDEDSSMLHTPIDEPDRQCSGRGQEVGDVKNICQRKDCHPTILRCPPDKQTPVDIEDYGSQDLTECKVEEMKCMDTTITFYWEYTKIRQVGSTRCCRLFLYGVFSLFLSSFVMT